MLRRNYNLFKASLLQIQLLRLTNMTFGTFSFWNLVLKPGPETGLTLVEPLLLAVTFPVGLVFAVVLLVSFSTRTHLLFLPFLAFSLLASSQTPAGILLFYIPAGGLCVLFLVNFIVFLANNLNRR